MSSRDTAEPGRPRSAASWWCATLDLPASAEDAVAPLLQEAGALGAELQPRGDRLRVLAYFDAHSDRGELERRLRECGGPDGILFHGALMAVADGRWEEEYQRSLSVFPVGRRLLVVPGESSPEPEDGRLALHIPPGRAFGTGDHATTLLCLEFLDREVKRGHHVLDVGTGSGILAIAAVRLGAARAVAVEPDREAAAVAARNFRRNGVAGRVELVVGKTSDVGSGWFDLLGANLFSGLLVELMPELAWLLRPGGRGVLSGLRDAEADVVLDAAAARGLEAREMEGRDGWVALQVHKPERCP